MLPYKNPRFYIQMGGPSGSNAATHQPRRRASVAGDRAEGRHDRDRRALYIELYTERVVSTGCRPREREHKWVIVTSAPQASSIDGGRTLLIADVLAAEGRGSARCPTVAITDDAPDPAAPQEVLDHSEQTQRLDLFRRHAEGMPQFLDHRVCRLVLPACSSVLTPCGTPRAAEVGARQLPGASSASSSRAAPFARWSSSNGLRRP